MEKRNVEIIVISDLHLGTFGCQAKEIVCYLKSVSPKILILNGDIIDGWQFNKRYFPNSHMQVISEIVNLITQGTRVIYITGNHDEMLRRYSGVTMGNFQVVDKFMLEINGKKTWIFHGDVFDATTKGGAKFLAKLGGYGYDLLIVLNSMINWCLKLFKKEKMSFSKKVKNAVKEAVVWIANFEQTAAELAIEKKYDYVICGHIHQPQKRIIETDKGSVTYLNSGDWVENLTALEYNNNNWDIYYYNEDEQNNKLNQDWFKPNKPKLNVISNEVDFSISSLGTIENVAFSIPVLK